MLVDLLVLVSDSHLGASPFVSQAELFVLPFVHFQEVTLGELGHRVQLLEALLSRENTAISVNVHRGSACKVFA